jgi:hypothetical protein
MTNNERENHHLDVTRLSIDELLVELSLRPIESIILQCTSNRRIDIGSLCYLERNYKTRKIPKPVGMHSLSIARSEMIREWCVENISKCKTESSGETLFTNAEELANFTNWCDDGEHSDFHSSEQQYKNALNAYTQHLILSIQSKNGIQTLRGNRLQSAAIKNATLFFPNTTINFLSDLPIIFNNAGDKTKGEKTITPSEQEMGEYLASCQYMFDGLTDFVLKGLPFPHRIPYRDTEALLLPTEYPISTTSIIAACAKAQNSIAWDYRSGTIRTLEECNALHSQMPHYVVRAVVEAQRNLQQANDDLRAAKRLWIGQIAQMAFITLFVANSAINESQLRKLTWSADYEITNSENAGFVVIKGRAGDLEQSFEVKKTFIKHFKKYLALRKYLCGDETPSLLFLRFTWNNLLESPIATAPIECFNIKMRFFIDPEFRGLTYRQLRKYKPVYLLSKKYSVSVVAAMIQSSGETTLKYYTEAEEKTAIDEISATLNFIISILDKESLTDTPSGGCGGGTLSEVEPPPDQYEPNCRNFVGCIYCKEFRIHADEETIRKVLSMRYVTAERLNSCSDMDQFQALHGKALERIDALISDLIKVKPEAKPMIDRVRNEIEQYCMLSPYWEMLYHRLLKLKVIK